MRPLLGEPVGDRLHYTSLRVLQRKLQRQYLQLQFDYATGCKTPLLENADLRYMLADLKAGRKRIIIVDAK